jgi:hypothetical protein
MNCATRGFRGQNQKKLVLLKVTVQRDLTGVDTRLKRSSLMNYVVAKFAFLILKEHHHKRSTKPVSASKQQLN